ncbi:hypothetical protein AAG897_02620 [Lacticaseibacillus rhamnosus]
MSDQSIQVVEDVVSTIVLKHIREAITRGDFYGMAIVHHLAAL